MRIEVSIGQTPSQQTASQIPDQSSSLARTAPSTSASSSSAAPATSANSTPYNFQNAVNIFPTIDKTKSPKTSVTVILQSNDAKDMQSQLIPKEGTKSPYGLTFNLATFTQMQGWSKSITVDPAWKSTYDSVVNSTYHPCCGATIATNDCGHAIAMTGLVKKMLQDGKSEADIKTDLMLWEKYFFPRHYVLMGLALKKGGGELSQIDLSPSYSSIQSEQYADNYLIY